MLQNGSVLDRRSFLLAGAGLPAALPGLATAGPDPVGLSLEYAAAAPVRVPSPLRLETPARVVLELTQVGTTARCVVAQRVALADEPCLLPLALWTGDRHYYRQARESQHLPASLADVNWAAGSWSVAAAGSRPLSVRSGPESRPLGDGAAPLPWATFRHTLAPDWRRGPLGDAQPELWFLRPGGNASAEEVSLDGISVEGDPGGWLARLGAAGPVSAAVVGSLQPPAPEFAQAVEAPDFEPFALRNYPGDSLGMVGLDTGFLQPGSIEAYRSRREVRLSGLTVVAIDATVDREAVLPMLPPPCETPEIAVVRVMGLRGLADPSLDEAWLFVQCHVDGERAWYAVSHVRAGVAGSEFGREALGYPTVEGTAAASLGANRFGVSVGRHGAPVYEGGGFYGGFSTGTSLGDMPVATLRLRHRPRQSMPAGEVVVQPWYYQGLRLPVSRESLFASFPASGTGADSAWSRMGPARAYWSTVFDSATLQRRPGTVVAEVDDVGPYFRDRCGGHLPWESQVPARQGASD